MTLVHLPLLALLLGGAPAPEPAAPEPAASPWWAADPGAPERGWQVEVAARALLGRGRTAYALYDHLGSTKVSNLDFHGIEGAGGELSARVSTGGRPWATVTAGLEARGTGTLQDEDFPVLGLLTVYSSTDSQLDGGGAWHLSAAAGYDVHQGARARLGLFAGVRHAAETLHADGCTQTATNTQICAGDGIPWTVRVITARTRWTAPLVGVDGALRLSSEVTLSASAAYLPFLSVSGSDTHWLRTGPPAPGVDFAGPTPITASDGLGVELEAGLRWRPGAGLILGIGGRFTRLEARGLMHFEESVYPQPGGPVLAQPVRLVTERRDLWLEAGWRF